MGEVRSEEPVPGRGDADRDGTVEVLVISPQGVDVRDALARAPEPVDLVHLLVPRLAIVRVRVGMLPPVPDAGCHLPPLPAEEGAGLTAAERLFVAAWELRSSGLHPGPRVGEGLPWDAPGFEPPDA